MNILVTGGAGYVGARLVPALLDKGHKVKVYDIFIYGEDVFDGARGNADLELIKADIRDQAAFGRAVKGMDVVIHLACISNDPSFELNPSLGKSINLDAFRPMVELSVKAGVKRFVYASSSSVYGVKSEPQVTEDMSLEPLTDYSKFKAECEKILLEYQSPTFTTCTLRPATVCGYSPRQRLDVIVNILTKDAFHKKSITILGGGQKRPNVHIDDMVAAYLHVLEQPAEKIAGKIYNVGDENHTVKDLADMVQQVVGNDVVLNTKPTNDNRSYHISSDKIRRELGFAPRRKIRDAVVDLKQALEAGKLPDALIDKRYYNIETMKAINLQ